jgi:formylglycine-generating enzyme required for sulfatase activity
LSPPAATPWSNRITLSAVVQLSCARQVVVAWLSRRLLPGRERLFFLGANLVIPAWGSLARPEAMRMKHITVGRDVSGVASTDRLTDRSSPRFSAVALVALLAACGSSEPAADCRTAEPPCPSGALCQATSDGVYACVVEAGDAGGEDASAPDDSGEDASAPGDSGGGPVDIAPDEGPCIPECGLDECGDDGCGGSCGVCAEGEICSIGACSPPPAGFVTIAPGSFTFGSPVSEPCHDQYETQHEMTLTRAFLLKATEVTQGEWFELMGTSPGHFTGCDACPVERVNWWEALAYCNALSVAEGLPTCYALGACQGTAGDDLECTGSDPAQASADPLDCEGYRLPTDAEWEYAARAGTTGATYNGDPDQGECFGGAAVLESIAWYLDNSGDVTHPVGGKLQNPWGLYDMLGNVQEWVWDHYSVHLEGGVDPRQVPNTHSPLVFRGGSWASVPRYCRAAYRSGASASHRNFELGFRPARTIP